MFDTSRLRAFSGLLFLKALSKKHITIPAYTKADGTYVPAHQKLVNYNPDHHAVLSGKSSHSHKEALKQLSKDPAFKQLPGEHQSHLVQGHAQDIQTAASKGAQVSVFKKDLLAGQKPKAANIAAFKELQEAEPKKAGAISAAIVDAIGMDKFLELTGVQPPAPPKVGPTQDELDQAFEKLQWIGTKPPKMHYPYLAWKKLTDDIKGWAALGNHVDKLQAVVTLGQQMQAKASADAAVSTLTSKLAAGKAPSPGELKAYQALEDGGKLKMAQTAIKKSGGKVSFAVLVDLLKQAEAKAGITVDKPEVVPLGKQPHFGQQHEGMTLGTSEGGSVFKFDGGKWSFIAGDGNWSKITNSHWEQKLGEGVHPTNDQPLKIVNNPGQSFGSQNANKVFDAGGPYLAKWSGGSWQFKMKDHGDDGSFVEITNPDFIAQLDKGKQVDTTGKPLVEVSNEAPTPDDGQWGYNENDPGMSGNPTLTAGGPNGEQIYIIGTDPIDGGPPFSVGIWSDPEEDPEFKEYHTAERVQAALQAKGYHPPEVATIAKLQEAANAPGPQEGDTKQGVGGVLTLKDGHWTLDNAGMLSFFNKHEIKPGSATAIAVTMAVSSIAQGKTASAIQDSLEAVRKAAKSDLFPVGNINHMIDKLLDMNSEVVSSDIQASEAGGKSAAPPDGVASSLAAAASFTYDHLLHNTTEGHSKFWQVTVDPEAKTATSHWGKIGTKGQSKTYQHASAKAAYDAAVEAAAAKQKHGYVTQAKVDAPATQAMASAQSFGKKNAGKTFAATMSNGVLGYYKFDGDKWNYSFNPNDGWDPVQQQSKLHDKLETGFNATDAKLIEVGPGQTAFVPKPDTVYESTLSTGKIVQFVHKDGVWNHVSAGTDGSVTLIPDIADHWLEALKVGEDINGTALVEAYPFKASGPSGGSAWKDGTHYTDGEHLYTFDEGKWHGKIQDFGDWFPIDPGTKLANALDKGENAKGFPLKPAAKFDDGPQEGDVKPGKGGWLILKDGHWVKANPEQVMAKLCPVPDDITSSYLKSTLGGLSALASAAQPLSKLWKKVKTTKMGMPNVTLTMGGGKFVGRAELVGGKWQGWGGSIAGANIAKALNWLEHAEKAHKAILAGKMPPPTPFPSTASAAAATAAPAAPSASPSFNAVPSIDGWPKTGAQGGYNEGGTYRDPDGDEWYCKFPAGGAKVARNELLANRLYEAAGLGVPEVKLISQGGKIGLASRIVKGAVQDVAALKAGQGEGLLSGFVADAWLANWDVVGNNPAAGKGWDNIMFLNGKAVRIDPGGALLYGGAGGKKTDFGNEVIELDTMRDAKVNARTAAVFGKISQADLQASAHKVLSIPDEEIEKMVLEHGPGDPAEKAALAKKLIARKAHIAGKFPKVAAKVAAGLSSFDSADDAPSKKSKVKKLDPRALPVKPSDLPEPHDFMNWGGSGKAISDKPYVQQNIVDEKAIFDFALKGDLVALKKYKFQPVEKETGTPLGDPKTMDAHPSAHVKSYYDSVVTFLDVIANPPEPLKAFNGKSADTINQLSSAFKPFKYGHSVASVPPNQRLGFWIALGTVANPKHFQPVNIFKQITAAAKAQAYNKWNMLPAGVRKFLKSVQGSGSANQPYRDGKMTDNQGQNCRKVLQDCYANASSHEEGFTIYKWINMPDSMVKQIMGQPEGLVFQNPGSMCCSRAATNTQGFGNHRVIMHYAKGAKAMDTFGSGNHSGEQEITTLPGARFMVLSRKMIANDKKYGGNSQRLELEVLMLPPDQTYVDNLKEAVG